MQTNRSVYLSLITVFVLGILSILVLSRNFSYPFPEAKISPIEQFTVIDLSGVVGGFRRLAADIAWIQLLVYYGEPKAKLDQETQYKMSWEYLKYLLGRENSFKDHHEEKDEETKEFETTKKLVKIDRERMFEELYLYNYRVVLLDPFFSYAYLYGAGALAWNQDRPEEAMNLLNYGISMMERYQKDITKDTHQSYWQLHLYMGAIIYRKEGNFDKMKESLEVAVGQKNCPNMVKAILASIYKKNKEYPKALKLWLDIHDTDDPTYQKRSIEEIESLRKLLNI
jgi:hypothetical protein